MAVEYSGHQESWHVHYGLCFNSNIINHINKKKEEENNQEWHNCFGCYNFKAGQIPLKLVNVKSSNWVVRDSTYNAFIYKENLHWYTMYPRVWVHSSKPSIVSRCVSGSSDCKPTCYADVGITTCYVEQDS